MTNRKSSKNKEKEKRHRLESELNEMKETLQRLQAEFENYSKRVEKEKIQFKRLVGAEYIRELLPVLDSLDNALEKIEKSPQDSEQAQKGIKQVREQFLGVLEKQGVKRIECMGKAFDPSTQECLAKGHLKEKEDAIVLEEVQPGYMFNDKVLRTAKVKVNSIE